MADFKVVWRFRVESEEVYSEDELFDILRLDQYRLSDEDDAAYEEDPEAFFMSHLENYVVWGDDCGVYENLRDPYPFVELEAVIDVTEE